MTDLPRDLEPSDAERLATLRAAMSPGGAEGESRSVGPIWRRDLAMAAVVGGNDAGGIDQTASKIDRFEITDDGTNVFTLTFDPIEDSQNVSCSWDLVSEEDYTLVGRTLTILDPATVFVGASSDLPKVLQVQYDYYDAVPVPPTGLTPGFANAHQNSGGTSTMTISFGFTAAEGSLLLLAIANDNGGTPATPTGYSLVDTVMSSGTRLSVFAKEADGSESSSSAAISGTTGNWLVAVLEYPGASVVEVATSSLNSGSIFVDTAAVGGALTVDFLSGSTGGFHSGSQLVNDTDLTDRAGGFIGYLGLRAGDAASASFRDGWGFDGLDQVTGSIQSIVVGIEA